MQVDQEDEEADEGEERWVELRARLYAEKLASRIAALLDEAPVLGSTGLPLSPGDILVLVRSRGELASLLVARLFASHAEGLMERKPRQPDEPILPRSMLMWLGLIGLVLGGTTLGVAAWGVMAVGADQAWRDDVSGLVAALVRG